MDRPTHFSTKTELKIDISRPDFYNSGHFIQLSSDFFDRAGCQPLDRMGDTTNYGSRPYNSITWSRLSAFRSDSGMEFLGTFNLPHQSSGVFGKNSGSKRGILDKKPACRQAGNN